MATQPSPEAVEIDVVEAAVAKGEIKEVLTYIGGRVFPFMGMSTSRKVSDREHQTRQGVEGLAW